MRLWGWQKEEMVTGALRGHKKKGKVECGRGKTLGQSRRTFALEARICETFHGMGKKERTIKATGQRGGEGLGMGERKGKGIGTVIYSHVFPVAVSQVARDQALNSLGRVQRKKLNGMRMVFLNGGNQMAGGNSHRKETREDRRQIIAQKKGTQKRES